MPLYQVDKENNALTPIRPSSFTSDQVLERKDLQPLLRDHWDVVDPDIFILDEEFGNFEGSSRRVDLLGLDREGNLVIIELKRVEEDGHLELQSLRYAAMLSSYNYDVVKIYEDFVKKRGKEVSSARQAVANFLRAEGNEVDTISPRPRIVLIAPSFSREVTTTVLWLNDMGLDIRCLEVKPYKLDDKMYLDIEQVIPLPSAQDYVFKLRRKAEESRTTAAIKRRASTLQILIEHQVLTPGVRLHLIRPPRSGMHIEEKAKWAT